MSERGSFCTQFFYCDKCAALAERVIGKKTQDCIISGFIGGIYVGEEAHAGEEWAREMAPEVCKSHEIVFVVIPDDLQATECFVVRRDLAEARRMFDTDGNDLLHEEPPKVFPNFVSLPAEMPERKAFVDLLYTGRNKKP